MEERYGLYSKGSCGWTSMRNEEFQEEDVWSFVKDMRDAAVPKASGSSTSIKSKYKHQSSSSFVITPSRLGSAARMIPMINKNPTHEPKIKQQTAPVNIPDWSKIYGADNPRKPSSKNPSWLDDDEEEEEEEENYKGLNGENWDNDEDEDKDNEGEMVPPHEWIARKLSRSQISSFSVCEGVGRTLKGRDLSRVRNAVLTRTGFLE